jgi:hypothetical protein
VPSTTSVNHRPFISQVDYGKIVGAGFEPSMPNLITAAASLFLWTFSKFGINEARAILLENDSAYKTFE